MASGATLVDESCDAMSVFPHPQPLSQEGEGSFESRWYDFHVKSMARLVAPSFF